MPTTATVLAAILLLGPPLGRLMPTATPHFWREIAPFVRPEPVEQARFLIALTSPLLLGAWTLLLVRRAPAPLARLSKPAAAAVELLVALVVVGCFVVQRVGVGQDTSEPFPYFSVPTLVVAVAIGCAMAALARISWIGKRWVRWTADAPVRRRAAVAGAVAAVGVTLLPVLSTDRSIAVAHEQVIFHQSIVFDEAMAVMDGRSPLGDFATQYASLVPYLLAGVMTLIGTSVGVFTALLAALLGVSLLALYGVLHRVARSGVAALALFVPLLATGAWHLRGETVARFSLVNYPGVLPLRYAGPFLLAWLVARRLDGARPHRIWPLFLAAGLVAINNPDFGLPALAASVAALALGDPSVRNPRALGESVLGVAGAVALVSALLLVRTGSLPDFSLLFVYAELFTRAGFGMFPIRPLVGLSTVMLITYLGAVGVATVRAARDADRRTLTGMLAWSGVFGLGVGAYYVGRSRSEQLFYLFPAWALALALLTIVAMRWLAASGRRPSASVLAVLVGFGLLVCSVPQTPAPWRQVKRIGHDGERLFAKPDGEAFVGQYALPGEPVVILGSLGHRIAYDLGLDDVEPYTGNRSVQTAEQLEDSLRALREQGGSKVFLWAGQTPGEAIEIVARSRVLLAEEWRDGLQLWVAR